MMGFNYGAFRVPTLKDFFMSILIISMSFAGLWILGTSF